jgi:hypothetical protein
LRYDKKKALFLGDVEDETIEGASTLVACAEAREELLEEEDTRKLGGSKSAIEATSEGDARHHEKYAEEDEP